MRQITEWDVTLTNTCECRYCTECCMGTEAESCEECKAETVPFVGCVGFCYDYKLEWIDEMVAEYSKNNGHNYLILHGANMGWRSSSGQTDPIRATGKEVLKILSINGEWTIRFHLDENNLLTMRRSSHDEPMGAQFYATPSDGDDDNA